MDEGDQIRASFRRATATYCHNHGKNQKLSERDCGAGDVYDTREVHCFPRYEVLLKLSFCFAFSVGSFTTPNVWKILGGTVWGIVKSPLFLWSAFILEYNELSTGAGSPK